jgi:hypothetical protein
MLPPKPDVRANRAGPAAVDPGDPGDLMIKTWFDLTLDAAFLGFETQRVVGLRLMKLAAGGAAAHTEAQLMVTGRWRLSPRPPRPWQRAARPGK